MKNTPCDTPDYDGHYQGVDEDTYDEEFEEDIVDISAEDLKEWQDASCGRC